MKIYLLSIVVVAILLSSSVVVHAASPRSEKKTIYNTSWFVAGRSISPDKVLNTEIILKEYGNYNEYINGIYTEGSPYYHHFITNDQFYAMFGPSPEAKIAIENWLISSGFTLGSSPSPFVIEASANAGAVSSAFSSNVVVYNGYYLFQTVPAMPAELSQFVAGILVTNGASPFRPMNTIPKISIPAQLKKDASASSAGSLSISLFGNNMIAIYGNLSEFEPITGYSSNYAISINGNGGTPPYHVSIATGDGSSFAVTSNSTLIPFKYDYMTSPWPSYVYMQSYFGTAMYLNTIHMYVNVSDSSGMSGQAIGFVVPMLSAKQVETAYNLNPLYGMNISGKGTTVGIVDMNDPTENGTAIIANLHVFDAAMGLTNPQVNLLGGGSRDPYLGQSGWAAETAMDLEWAHSMAPNATIDLYLAANYTINGDAYLTNHSVDVISNSWAWGENATSSALIGIGIGTMAYGNVTWQMAAAKGITIDTASGDDGSQAYWWNTTTDTYGVGNMLVNFPSVEPYGLGVGGTSVKIANSGGWTAEYPWNGTGASYVPGGSNSEGSGGGFSKIFASPSWQKGVYGFPSNETMRGIPDISADSVTFIAEYQGGSWYADGGTSLATPLISGIIDLAYGYNGSGLIGFAGPALYKIASNSKLYNMSFHDIVLGNNTVDGHGYKARPGWDAVTGLGTPNAANLVESIVNVLYKKAYSGLTVSISSEINSALPVEYLYANTGGGNSTSYSYKWFLNGAPVGNDNPFLNLTYKYGGVYHISVVVNGIKASIISTINGNSYYISGYVLSPSGSPLSGALVSIGSRSTYTNSNGLYVLSVYNSTYNLAVSYPSLRGVTKQVTVNGSSVLLNVSLSPFVYEVNGYVVASGKTGIANAMIEIDNMTITTSSDGSFTLHLTNGTYLVYVSAAGMVPIFTHIVVNGNNVTENISLTSATGKLVVMVKANQQISVYLNGKMINLTNNSYTSILDEGYYWVNATYNGQQIYSAYVYVEYNHTVESTIYYNKTVSSSTSSSTVSSSTTNILEAIGMLVVGLVIGILLGLLMFRRKKVVTPAPGYNTAYGTQQETVENVPPEQPQQNQQPPSGQV